MTDQDAMKLALEALETEVSIDWTNDDEFNASAEKMHEAIAALKKQLADYAMRETQRLGQEIEQEPVAWLVEFENGEQELHFDEQSVGEIHTPLYTHPPQRTEPSQQKKVWTFWDLSGGDIADAIKAKLKEKNT